MSSDAPAHTSALRLDQVAARRGKRGRQRGRYAVLLPLPVLLLAIALMPGERGAAQVGLGVASGSAASFRSHMEGGRNQGASVPQLQAEIREQGPSAELYSELGVALYRKHQPDKSLNAFTSMLKFRQPNADELRIVALDYLELRDLPSADKWLRASIKLNPSDWRTWRYLGGVQFSEELVADAAASFSACLRLDPHNALAEDGLARALDAQGRPAEAEKHFETAKQLNLSADEPSSLPSLHYGEFLLRQRRLGEAQSELAHSVQLSPDDSEAHESLSRLYSETGETEQALEEMRKASQLRPESPRLHLLLGRLYRAAGKRSEANTEIDEYVELSREHRDAWDR